MTFGETAKDWLELHRLRISYTTYRGYLYFLGLTASIEHIEMSELNFMHLQKVVNESISHGYSRRTIKGLRDTIGQVFKYAIKCRYITLNITDLLELPRGNNTKHRGCLTKEQVQLALNYPHKYQNYILLLYYTGMRRGEAMALKWNDINFDKQIINLCRAVEYIGNTPVEKTTKTENGVRLIPIPSALCTKLKEMRKLSVNDLVFTQISTGKPHTPSSYRKMWNRWFNDFSEYVESKLSVKLNRITAHMFRHTYITLLFENDVPDMVIQRLAGHADIAFTRRQYTHLRETFLEQSYDNVRKILEG